MKVKEPLPAEYGLLRPDQILFTYLHLAANKRLTEALLATGATCIAYETVEVNRRLPLLEPMSEIAGRMSIIVGGYFLAKHAGGKGVLLGGVPGVLPGKVVVIGGGTSGVNAARMATGLGADVTILEVDLERMRFLDITMHTAHTLYSSEASLLELLPSVDLLIGAVLVPGARAPKLISRDMLRLMRPRQRARRYRHRSGRLRRDLAPHDASRPVFTEEGVLHYCVANMQAPTPAPPRRPSRTSPTATSRPSPISASPKPANATRVSPMASTFRTAASPSSPSPRPSTSRSHPRGSGKPVSMDRDRPSAARVALSIHLNRPRARVRKTPSTMAQDLQTLIRDIGRRAREASRPLSNLGTETKNAILRAMADELLAREAAILEANAADLAGAREHGLAPVAIDRLTLTPERLRKIATDVRHVADLPDPVNEVLAEWTRPNGIRISKVRKPIGVIGIIYESRPNVTCDAAVLCIKTGNAVILRGGSESLRSNLAIAEALQAGGARAGLPADAIQLIPVTDREAVKLLAQADEFLDVIVPRGGKSLIEAVVSSARMPVIKHYDGVCHIYVDAAADVEMATRILVNAKCQRPGVCNSAECVVIHRDIAEKFLAAAAPELAAQGVELRADETSFSQLSTLNYPLLAPRSRRTTAPNTSRSSSA